MSEADDRPPRVISEKKRAANRANARKSTGPRTAAGKARVSLNALTHGMTAHACVLPFENADHFEKFAQALRADLEPVGFREGAERGVHGPVYTLTGIFLSRHIM